MEEEQRVCHVALLRLLPLAHWFGAPAVGSRAGHSASRRFTVVTELEDNLLASAVTASRGQPKAAELDMLDRCVFSDARACALTCLWRL